MSLAGACYCFLSWQERFFDTVFRRLRVENRYEIIIFWSDEDGSFVADVPELPGCMAHGASHAEALANAEEAVQLWIETAISLGRSIPQPKGRRLLYA